MAQVWREAHCKLCGGKGKVADVPATFEGKRLVLKPCPACRQPEEKP